MSITFDTNEQIRDWLMGIAGSVYDNLRDLANDDTFNTSDVLEEVRLYAALIIVARMMTEGTYWTELDD